MTRRVAVTGMGAVSPLGATLAAAFEAACAGHSAVQRLEGACCALMDDPLGAPAEPGALVFLEPSTRRMLDRAAAFALDAAEQAVEDAQGALVDVSPESIGVFSGSGIGGIGALDDGYRALYAEGARKLKPFTVLMAMANSAAAWMGIRHGAQGPNLSYANACSSANVAIGEAAGRIARGELEVAIAGGAEAPLAPGHLKAWDALRTLATSAEAEPASACRPFSANRSGLVLGEGAAMLVLEPLERARARGARVHGEVLGCGLVNEAAHITRPSVDGQARAMRAALRSADLEPCAVDAINAHGTGTRANDPVESAAIRAVFGQRSDSIPVSATKAIHGHLLGATGALEAALSFCAMRAQLALPTMHLDVPDPECDLDYVPNVVRTGVLARTLLSNSFAFGGSNAVLVLGAGD